MALEYEEKLPDDIPGSLPVYALEEPPVFPGSAALLGKVAAQMGMEARADEMCTSSDWTVHREGLNRLAVHSQSGGVTYQHMERYGGGRGGEEEKEARIEFDDDRATGLAERFLERLDVLLSMREAQPAGVTHLRSAGGDREGKEVREVLLDAGVVFERAVEGVGVHGPGGTAMINVGPEEEVVGFRTIWRPIAEVAAEVKVLPPDPAYSAIERVAERVRGDVTVTKARFGYFEQGIADRQAFLQPAYSLVYKVQDKQVAYKAAEVVAASEQAFEPLLFEKRFPHPAQEPRRG